jgi:photosystem II stability/assembly factor-like uncharacterized protein
MRRLHLFFSTLFLSLLLSACGGGGGGDGSAFAALAALASAVTGAGTHTDTAGTTPDTGTNPDTGTATGTISLKTLVAVSAQEPGTRCASGGVRIDAGLDSDGNGVLAAGEVGNTQYVCAGAAGISGTLAQMRDEASGANCAAGGKAIDVGLDGNANGQLDAPEISSTGYVCGGTTGSNAASGPSMLASIASEAAGANCAYGGSKVIMGLDINANSVLDAGEVNATNYICNSMPAATFPWVDVTGAAVQAQSNTGYIARNDMAQVVVTLPANPAVGDVVRIKGSGLGGWKMAQNAGQTVNTTNLGGTAGATWTVRGPELGQDWKSVASSADGTKLVAVVDGGQIYTSNDSGVTWTPRAENRSWQSVASSADGSKLVAVENGDLIYTSIDSGQSWTPCMGSAPCDGPQPWTAVASSADGSKLVAVAKGRPIYTSTDGGTSWTAHDDMFLIRPWLSVASSADGSKLVAGGDAIFISTDGGTNWDTCGALTCQMPSNWHAVALSADGSMMMAGESPGNMYISSDDGESWTRPTTIGSGGSWSLASSSDGRKLAVASRLGRFYTSGDSGAHWTERASGQDWGSVASSADGSQLVTVMRSGGRIYISTPTTIPGPSGSISGTSSDAIELQYVGQGVFTVSSHEGSLTIQ